MAASMVLCEVLHPAPSHRPDSRNYRTLPLDSSQFLYINPLVTFRKQISPLNIRPKTLKFPKARPVPVIAATQSNFSRALQTVWKVGRDGIDAATNLVPGLVPRPIARISVTVVTLAVALFALKSLLSTVFFVLATMGLVYFAFIALNKDEGPRSGSGTTTTEDSLEEARRIMEKYK